VLVLTTASVIDSVAEIAGDKFETHLLAVAQQGAHVVPMQ
jgi:ABC-type Zn uptake system ZnuABC Zn-binding protein ZnuA